MLPLRMTTRPGTVQHTNTATPSTGNGSDKLSATSDLLQRPRTTSAPRVRIEGPRLAWPGVARATGPAARTSLLVPRPAA